MNFDLNLIPKHFAFFAKTHLVDQVWELFLFAHKARKEGLLSLEPEIKKQKHSMIKNGLRFLCEGSEPEIMSTVLTHQKEQEVAVLTNEVELVELLYRLELDAKEKAQEEWLLEVSRFMGAKAKALETLIALIKGQIGKSKQKTSSPALDLFIKLLDQRPSTHDFAPLFHFFSSQILAEKQRQRDIICQGLEAISSAWHPRDLLVSLQIYLLEEEDKTLQRKIKAWEKKNESSFRQSKNQKTSLTKPKDHKTIDLSHLSFLSSGDIALILKEIPVGELATALFSANIQTRMLFFEELNDRARSMIIEEIETMKEPSEEESREAQVAILEITRRLIDEGTIQW